MKKTLAVLLAVLMVAAMLPLGMTAKAAEATKEPFYALGWSDINEEKFPNLNGLPTANISTKTDAETGEAYVTLSYDGHTAASGMARKLKTEMDARPEGMRYLHLFGPGRALGLDPVSCVYLDKGVDQLKVLVDALLKEYKALGGVLDGIIIDVEYIYMGTWYIYSEEYYQKDSKGNSLGVVNPNIYQEIVDNPKYATEIRPLLEERGFVFNTKDPTAAAWVAYKPSDYTGKQGVKSELWGIWPSTRKTAAEKVTYANCEAIWNAVMSNRLAAYMNDAIFAPLQQYFPDATLSDYQTEDTYAWNKGVSDQGGTEYLGGNRDKIGNVSNDNTYSYAPNGTFYADGYTNIAGYNKAYFEDDAYNMFLFDANRFKDMYAATDTKMISAWIAEYDYVQRHPPKDKDGNKVDRLGTVCNTPYYSETILHIGMLDPEPFLIYMYKPEYKTKEWNERMQVISDLMNELTRVAGWSDRKPIETPSNWNDGFVLSGMYAGGRNIWRITPDLTDGTTTLADFKVKDKAPTFSINGKTITFPQGRIIEDGTVGVVGTCGYWIETPANVTPVITTDADRYAENPSYFEDFESYTEGRFGSVQITTFRKDTVDVWSVSGSPSVVQTQGGKALALSGTATVKNLTFPAIITAGDSYAEQQGWEVSFTLQSAMSDGESVKLLICDSDAGIKLQDNKVYYNNSTQLGDVTLSAGTKYTVRREMDFDNKKCSYYLLSGGTVLAKAENVSISATKAATVSFSSQSISGQKVLIDDYKLYPMGLTTDFELYNATTGIRIENGSTNLKEVAYRISWLNGTDTAKKVNVMVKSGNGSAQKLKEIVMAPGCDGVVTGVVSNSSGAQLQVYLSDATNTTVATTPNYDTGDFSWTAQGAVTPPGAGPETPVEPPVTTDPDETTTPTDPSDDPTGPVDPTDPNASDDPTAPDVPTDPNGTGEPGATDTTGVPADPDTTEDGKTPDKSKGLSGGVIALIVVGAVLVAAGAGIGIWYLVAKESFLAIVKKIFRK